MSKKMEICLIVICVIGSIIIVIGGWDIYNSVIDCQYSEDELLAMIKNYAAITFANIN